MGSVKRWYARLAAMLGAAAAICLVPVAAWASTSPGAVAVGSELARSRPRAGRGGLLGGGCCLVVVLLIVVIVLLISRRRRQPPGPR
jgi:hypothetical protein